MGSEQLCASGDEITAIDRQYDTRDEPGLRAAQEHDRSRHVFRCSPTAQGRSCEDGLALILGYLADLESGAMRKQGQPTVLADHPAALTWDGLRLPGPWLVLKTMELAMQRAASQGTCTVVIRRSHHIACLPAYLQRATDSAGWPVQRPPAPGVQAEILAHQRFPARLPAGYMVAENPPSTTRMCPLTNAAASDAR